MSTYTTTGSSTAWTHPVIYDHYETDWSSDEDLFNSIRRVEQLTHFVESSATKIQKIWWGYKTRKEIGQDMEVSLKRASLRKYQKANLIRGRCYIAPSFYNAMPFWSDDSTMETLPRVCFNEDCYTKTIGEKRTKSSQTDFRVRSQKPVNIAVKILNCVIKNQPFSQFLVNIPHQDLLEIDSIFKEAGQSLKTKGKYRFCDPHSTSISAERFGVLAQAHMILRIHAKLPTPISCTTQPITQAMDIEYRLAGLKPSTPTTPLPLPKLARSGPRRIVGVPVTRPIKPYSENGDIEARLALLLAKRY